MGKLLVFAREHRSEAEQSMPNEEAQVVLFTGVRYERQPLPEKSEADGDPKPKRQPETGS